MNDRFSHIFVTDFDGTLTQVDFFQAVLAEILDNDLSLWGDYTRGSLTHFEVLAGYYRRIPWTRQRVLDLVWSLGFPPDFSRLIDQLHQADWGLVIASAGCEWYIDALLERAGARQRVEVHANKGRFAEPHGLIMELPRESPFFHPTIGIGKEDVVRHWINRGKQVAFAGDGPTDLAPALLVPASLRFARGALAQLLTQKGESFQRFENWSEIALRLAENPLTG